jgi:L-glyceraldehyde 3-phosphate reductase
MALSWLLKDKRVTTVLIGASSVKQLQDNLGCLANVSFSAEELAAIENILSMPN